MDIDGLKPILSALERIDLASVQERALAAEAAQLASLVRESLSHPPGSDHATPWLRTGDLRESITTNVDLDMAIVGSADPLAVDQEHGTRTIPPRPFLAPAGAAGSENAARGIGGRLAEAIQDALR